MGGHILEGMFFPPEKFPDIYVLWNLSVCWACFCLYWGWLVWGLWKGDVGYLVNRSPLKRKVE
jgi:hypothetical protein